MNKSNNDEKRRFKMIIMMLIIIIIILLLITSCNSKYWGRIGEYINETEVDLDDDSGERDVILNKNLRFDDDKFNLYLSDVDGRLSFHYTNIKPTNLTCTTSDSDIATCFVKDGYVVVHPKDTGDIDVVVEGLANGKKYRAKSKVKVKDSKPYISLSSKRGTINLKGNKKIIVSYRLVGISGNVTVDIDNDSIADVSVKNGVLTVVGKKVGKAKITVSVKRNSKTYKDTYNLTVINTTNKKKSSKSSDSSLKSLSSSKGRVKLKSGVYDYYVSVDNSVKNLDIDAVPRDSKAKVKYKVNGKVVDNLNDVELKVGNNKIEIVVIAEDGSSTTYHVNVNRSKPSKSSNNSLSELKVSEGSLSPKFNEKVLDYHVTVDSSVDSIDIYPKVKDKKAKVKYRYKGREVESLEDLPLEFGDNKVEILVTSESGETKKYTVTVEKKKSDDNYLKDLDVSSGSELKFDKNTNSYTVNVPYDQDTITVTSDVEDSKSKTSYKFNGKEVESLEDLELNPGDNEVEVTVTSESGKKRTYKVTIHKAVRTVEFDSSSYTLDIENTGILVYRVYEDGVLLSDDQYDKDDIDFTIEGYQGTIEKHNGYISLIPDPSMADETKKATIQYAGSSSSADVTFRYVEHFVNSPVDEYDVDFTGDNNERSFVLHNNMFSGNVKSKRLNDRTIRVYEEGNEDIYIDIEYDPDELEIESVEGSTSVSVTVKPKKSGKLKLGVSGYYKGVPVNSFPIIINSIMKYILKLDANGGYFDQFTTYYEFALEEDTNFDLTDYFDGYYEDEDCLHYQLESFNTSKDGSGTKYDFDNKNIVIKEDTVLYAIYSKDPIDEPIEEEYNYYLVDVDLFHNEEYFQKYNRDKIIYPGATGFYKMTFDNNTSSDIEITSVTLEEDTICVDEDGVKGCLNMGYAVRDYEGNYYLGGNNNYSIVNRKADEVDGYHTKKVITFKDPITLNHGASTEIHLLWQWVDFDDDGPNDKLDTKIGDYAGNKLNDMYQLTVSIQFNKTKTTCDKNGG